MEKYVAREREKTIKLVTSLTTEPAVVLVDSRACLIDSLINELKNSGQFSHVHCSVSIAELLNNSEFKDINVNMIILSLDVLNTANQSDAIDQIRSRFGHDTQIVFLADKTEYGAGSRHGQTQHQWHHSKLLQCRTGRSMPKGNRYWREIYPPKVDD